MLIVRLLPLAQKNLRLKQKENKEEEKELGVGKEIKVFITVVVFLKRSLRFKIAATKLLRIL